MIAGVATDTRADAAFAVDTCSGGAEDDGSACSVFSLLVGRSYSMVELLHVFAVMVATSIFRTGDACLGHVPMRLFLMSPPSCHLQSSDFHALVDDSPSSPYEPATET